MKSTPAFFRSAVLSAVILTVPLMSITNCSKRSKELPHSNDSVTVPYQEFGKTTMFFYDGPNKVWRLEADYMRKELSDTARMLGVPVKLTLYDSTGMTGTTILSDSGYMNPDMENFFIWGNVYVHTEDNMIIRSQSLWWDKHTAKVGSDDFVQIKTPEGDILRGKGLDADENFSRWSLRKSVSGSFPNFRERMEADGETQDSSAEKKSK